MTTPTKRKDSAAGTGKPEATLDRASTAAIIDPGKIFTKPTPTVRYDEKAYICIVSGTEGKTIYQKFILTEWARGSSEQMQTVLHTEGWNLIFQRGKPTTWRFDGILYNGPNDPLGYFNWTNEFIELYESSLRGSMAAAKSYECYVSFGGRQVSGYLFNMNMSSTSQLDTVTNFSFNMISTQEKPTTVASGSA